MRLAVACAFIFGLLFAQTAYVAEYTKKQKAEAKTFAKKNIKNFNRASSAIICKKPKLACADMVKSGNKYVWKPNCLPASSSIDLGNFNNSIGLPAGYRVCNSSLHILFPG